MSDLKGFASRLKEAIDSRGMSIYALAKASGIARGTIHNLLKGKSEPSAVKLHAISAALGVPMDWLLTGKKPKEPEPEEDNQETYKIYGGEVPYYIAQAEELRQIKRMVDHIWTEGKAANRELLEDHLKSQMALIESEKKVKK